MELDCIDQIYCMSRLQWTLPQEFGLFTVFLCGTYLIRYLRSGPKWNPQGKKYRIRYDENLLIFAMALAVSVATHFYVTIMAFFVCAAIAVYFLKRIFSKKYFLPLVVGILLGVIVAVVPMISALATGMEFQGSIGWALGVIEDSRDHSSRREEAKENEGLGNHWEFSDSDIEGGIVTEGIPEADEEIIANTGNNSPVERFKDILKNEYTKCADWIKRFYQYSYNTLYKEGRSPLLVAFTVLGMLLGLGCSISVWIIKRKTAKTYPNKWINFMILYAAKYIGLPELIANSRVCSTVHLLLMAVIMIPLDLIFFLLAENVKGIFLQGLSVICCVLICAVTVGLGCYHSYLYYEYSRYPAVVELTNRIIQDVRPQSYTIVSCVDELYQMIDYGYHEEAVVFLENSTKDHYTLPTEYVFCYVEKQPLAYGHSHFFNGPAWLGRQEYAELLSDYVSQCPEVMHGENSREAADSDIVLPLTSKSYSNFESRVVVQSRMHEWCLRFMELYPNQMESVYEDESFVCYVFKQNPARLHELAISY